MIFSLLHVPRCRIHSLASCWGETFNSFSKTYGNNSSVRLLSSRIYGLQGGHRKKWTRKPITTNTEGTGSTKSRSTKNEILSETILSSANVNVNKAHLDQFEEIQYCDIQEIAENKDLSSLVTVIVFDIETTGFSRENERIIEIALRDLKGGENSTFQTLVNPRRYVPGNVSCINGITTEMVNRPDVPRMEDLVPILLQYVRSRHKPGGYVLWIGHNARSFDVPFIINELRRCSMEVPPNWLFADTLPLARELRKRFPEKFEPKKSEVLTGKQLYSTSLSLVALGQLYKIQMDEAAHRAMADVNMLTEILPNLTRDLELTLSDLVKRSFRESDIINSKKKKNS